MPGLLHFLAIWFWGQNYQVTMFYVYLLLFLTSLSFILLFSRVHAKLGEKHRHKRCAKNQETKICNEPFTQSFLVLLRIFELQHRQTFLRFCKIINALFHNLGILKLFDCKSCKLSCPFNPTFLCLAFNNWVSSDMERTKNY